MTENNSTLDGEVILGIDPGTRITGYGVVRKQNRLCTALDYGCIRPPAKLKLSEKYLVIFDAIEELIDRYQPIAVVVETQYMQKNAQSAIKLGMARGAIMIAAKKKGLAVYGYTPTVAKKAVTGYGNASKFQVRGMVQGILNLPIAPEPEDAADALALAICHSHAASYLHTQREI